MTLLYADTSALGVTRAVATRAGHLAWEHDLRGYDAMQLAAALTWQDTVEAGGDEVVFACFDHDLRRAATAAGLKTWPV